MSEQHERLDFDAPDAAAVYLDIVGDTINGFDVWFNWGAGEFSGFIIGMGQTREAALETARTTLAVALNRLQEAMK